MSNYAVSTMARKDVTSSGGAYEFTTAPGSIFRTNPSGNDPSGTKVGVVQSHYNHAFMATSNPITYDGGGTRYYTQSPYPGVVIIPDTKPKPPKPNHKRGRAPRVMRFGTCVLRITGCDVFLRKVGTPPTPYDISGKNWIEIEKANAGDQLNLVVLEKDEDGNRTYSLGVVITCEIKNVKNSGECMNVVEIEELINESHDEGRLFYGRVRSLYATGSASDAYSVYTRDGTPASASLGHKIKTRYSVSNYSPNKERDREVFWIADAPSDTISIYLYNAAKFGPGAADVQPSYETADTSNYQFAFYQTGTKYQDDEDAERQATSKSGGSDEDTYTGGTSSKVIRADGVAKAMREGNYNSYTNSFEPSAVTGDRYPALVTGNFQRAAGDFSLYFNLPGTGYSGRTTK